MIEADPDYDTYFELFTEKSMVPVGSPKILNTLILV